jgi:hypothetical protein
VTPPPSERACTVACRGRLRSALPFAGLLCIRDFSVGSVAVDGAVGGAVSVTSGGLVAGGGPVTSGVFAVGGGSVGAGVVVIVDVSRSVVPSPTSVTCRNVGHSITTCPLESSVRSKFLLTDTPPSGGTQLHGKYVFDVQRCVSRTLMMPFTGPGCCGLNTTPKEHPAEGANSVPLQPSPLTSKPLSVIDTAVTVMAYPNGLRISILRTGLMSPTATLPNDSSGPASRDGMPS